VQLLENWLWIIFSVRGKKNKRKNEQGSVSLSLIQVRKNTPFFQCPITPAKSDRILELINFIRYYHHPGPGES
jgi:hypothetical protein